MTCTQAAQVGWSELPAWDEDKSIATGTRQFNTSANTSPRRGGPDECPGECNVLPPSLFSFSSYYAQLLKCSPPLSSHPPVLP